MFHRASKVAGGRVLAVVVGLLLLCGMLGGAARAAGLDDRFNLPGNVLISDQFNNRVIEVNATGEIIWSFGLGPYDVSPQSPIGVNDAQRVGILTLVTATGDPNGVEPNCPLGCIDSRVMLVDPWGRIVWKYGKPGVAGSGNDELDTPVQATWLPNNHVLITDQGNQRVIEVTLGKEIVWQYGTTGIWGSGPNQLDNPNSAELLRNGRVLIADQGNDRAIEVSRTGQIAATFTAGGTLSGCAFASRLPNGNTLLTDPGNSRIVEVSPLDQVVWEYYTNWAPGSNPWPYPSRAVRLRSGKTLISDQFNHRVIVVNKSKAVVETYGNLNYPGYGEDSTWEGLYAPYDAKVIGDYTGLTAPFPAY